MFLIADTDVDIIKAQKISDKLNIEFSTNTSLLESNELMLYYNSNGLSLKSGSLMMHGDLTTMLPRLKPNNLNGESIVKAAKFKFSDRIPLAIDATAGMGEDSLLLAAAGYRVIMFEANPVIAALLSDSIERAYANPLIAPYVSRMHLFSGDSITALTDLTDFLSNTVLSDMPDLPECPDVVLLDPMFPTRNKSGMIKKKFQLLQQLEMPCSNESELLNAAIKAKPNKIVIKRPAKGPFLAGQKPSYSIDGKSIRYDCIVYPNN